MIVNEKAGFAFTHIQKCGGTSVKEYLLNIEGSQYVEPEKGYCHSCVLDMPQYRNLFNFAIIRNPLHWYLSTYFFGKRANNLESRIFGDVNKMTFKEWLPNILNPKNSIIEAEVWDSEIGFAVPKEIITEGRLDVGWFTYRFLYGVCGKHKWIFQYWSKEEILKFYPLVIDINCLIPLEELDSLLFPVLSKNTKISKQPKKLGKKNSTTYNREIEAHYDKEMLDMVYKQEALFFELHYKADNTEPWYRSNHDRDTPIHKR